MHKEVGETARRHGALLLTCGECSRSMGGEHSRAARRSYRPVKERVRPGDTVLIKRATPMRFDEVTEALLEYLHK